MTSKGIDRREFGKILGAAGMGRVLPGSRGQQSPAADRSAAAPEPYLFFTREEAAFIDAAVDRLIPADELGPGAREAGVTVFIDRQLAGAYGTAAKWYMQGPFGESTPEQGYQRPLTPQELYRVAIAAANALTRSRHDDRFDLLTPEQQDEILKAMDDGSLPLDDVPVAEFFSMLLANTMEGFFADPVYGGNRDKAGWRLVGFPGVGASYRNLIERYDEPYDVEPVSIEDVLERRARVDEHGHVLHEPTRGRTGRGRGQGQGQGR